MVGGNLGYFVLPSWRISGSYTNIHGSTDQLNSVSVIGAQTDYYFTPTWSLFLEYYSSSYPKLLANKAGTYKYPVNASQFVAGLGFPIYNSEGFGINGAASYSGITLDKSKDTAVVAETNLANDTSRFEVVLSTYISKATAALTYWSGKEVLGVRSRGAIVMDSTDLHKDGEKLSLGYAINKYLSLGASYGMETYTAEDTTAKYRDFQSSTMTGLVSINW